jgi:hypothetical protein
VYLTWCDFAVVLTKEQHQMLCKSQKMCDRVPGNDQTSVWGRKREPYTDVWMACLVQGRPKKARQVRSKVKSMLNHKEFVMAGQTVNSAYFCDILWQLSQNFWRLRPEHWWQKNWL